LIVGADVVIVSLLSPRPPLLGFAAARTADGLLLLDAAQLALANMPALAAHIAQDAALRNFAAKPLEKLFISLTPSAYNLNQLIFLLFCIDGDFSN
jgi:hypothetical protein